MSKIYLFVFILFQVFYSGCSHNSCFWDDKIWICSDSEGNISKDHSKAFIFGNNEDNDFLTGNLSLLKQEQISVDLGQYLDLILAYLKAAKIRKISVDNLSEYIDLAERIKKTQFYELLEKREVWLLHFIFNVVLSQCFGLENSRLPLTFIAEARAWFFNHPKFKDIPAGLPEFVMRDIKKYR